MLWKKWENKNKNKIIVYVVVKKKYEQNIDTKYVGSNQKNHSHTITHRGDIVYSKKSNGSGCFDLSTIRNQEVLKRFDSIHSKNMEVFIQIKEFGFIFALSFQIRNFQYVGTSSSRTPLGNETINNGKFYTYTLIPHVCSWYFIIISFKFWHLWFFLGCC